MPHDLAGFVPAAGEIERVLSRASAADAALLAQQYLRAGAPAAALAVCEMAMTAHGADSALLLSAASARFAAGDRAEAMRLVARVLSKVDDHPGALHLKAHFHAALGEVHAARESFGRVVERYPDYPGAQGALSALLFPGRPYRDVVAAVHRTLRPATYLEVGVETGATLALAAAAEIAVGIDPDPGALSVPLPPRARTYAMTSDEFFARETKQSAFGGRSVDLAFIDGMHWFEVALRDFVGVERWASPSGTVLLHDCLPVTRVAADRERRSTFWVGDTWKVLDCLLEYRPDLRIRVVPTAPSGLVVVRHLDPESTRLADAMPEIVARYRDLAYPHEPGSWPERYGVVTNDAAGIGEALEVTKTP